MTYELFGPKTSGALDVWSLEHVLSGISVAHMLRRLPLRVALGYMGLIAFAWESVEHYLEEGLAGPRVALWFHGVECFANRCVADPLMMLIGLAIARRWPHLPWLARAASLAWLTVHILVFPHSMYLQERLFG